MRISDWSSDVCSSDLVKVISAAAHQSRTVSFINALSLSVSKPSMVIGRCRRNSSSTLVSRLCSRNSKGAHSVHPVAMSVRTNVWAKLPLATGPLCDTRSASKRSEEHTSELQSLMRISYAVFCLKKKTQKRHKHIQTRHSN